MKTVIYSEYGLPEVLQIKEIEKPTPGDFEVLIKIHAASVNYGDLIARNFRYISPKEFNMLFLFWLMAKVAFGLKKPRIKILGREFSGMVESVGKSVTKFKTGNPVFGYRGQNMGAYAEYITMKESGVLAIKPSSMSYQEAAVVPYGSIMALNLLRKMNIKPGQKILINGASGGIGSAAVQIAKHFGAKVTGVCGTHRIEFVKSLGADRVIDYTKEDFTINGETYDLIFDILGKCSYSKYKNSLSSNGRIFYASFKTRKLIQSLWNRRMVCALAPGSLDDLLSVKELIEAGIIKVTIDQAFTMENIADAHRYAESGKHKGKIAILVSN